MCVITGVGRRRDVCRTFRWGFGELNAYFIACSIREYNMRLLWFVLNEGMYEL